MPLEHFSGPEGQRPEKRPQVDPEEVAAERQAELAAIAEREAEDTWPPKVLDGFLDDMFAELDPSNDDAGAEKTELAEEPSDEADLDAAFDDFLGSDEAGEVDSAALDLEESFGDFLDSDSGAEVDLEAGFDDFLGEVPEQAAEATERPSARLATVKTWVETEYPEFQPSDQAATLCCQREIDTRLLMPSYDVTKDSSTVYFLAETMTVQTNQDTAERSEIAAAAEAVTSQATAAVDTALSDDKARVTADQAQVVNDQAQLAETTETLATDRERWAEVIAEADTMEALGEVYSEMLATQGQQKALETIIAQTKSPEIRGRLAGILSTLRKVLSVVPEADQKAVSTLFDTTQLNIFGTSTVDQFSPVLAAIDDDPTVSAEAKAAIRETVYREHYDRTGGDVRASATATTTNENGKIVPVYTADNPKPVRPGVSAYSETGAEVMVRLDLPGHPPVTREVTGWSDDDIGLLTEAMGFAAGLEEYGVTGFVEDIYKIDFNVLGDSAFDRNSLRDIRQMISAMVGSFEGYDGDIFDVREKIGLIRHQARLLSDENTAYGTENSRDNTLRSARKLGLRSEDGELNFAVLKEFGRYAQETYLSEDATHADVQARLYSLFPQFVEAPEQSVSEAA